MQARYLATAAMLLAACASLEDWTDEPTDRASAPIVGGITDTGHPYVVAVGDQFQPWCSATLISTRTVLTAAHCAFGITHIHFGTNLTGPPAPVPTLQEIAHPEFDINTLQDSDLAVVQLSADTGLQPAALLRATLDNSSYYMGPDWTFVGFGVDDGMQQTGFGVKRVAAFPYLTLGPTTTTPDNMPVSEDFVYYQTNLQSGCNGDSGGPSFFVEDGIEKQGAVTSWGSQFCDQYGVYARIDQPYIDEFVQMHIDAFEPNNPCKNDGNCNASCQSGGQVMDPDCHQLHCGADGVCSVACAQPVDPDCAFMNIDHCGETGTCDPTCLADPDCGPVVNTVASSSSASSSSSSSSSSASSSSSSSSSSSVSSSSSSSVSSSSSSSSSVSSTATSTSSSTSTSTSTSTSGGNEGSGGEDFVDDDDLIFGRGCTVTPGEPSDQDLAWIALLGLALGVFRRRT